MSTGTVKFFNETKGFGFIKVSGSNQEIFVHVSELKDQIRQDDEVVFNIQEGKRGLNAVNVKLA
ncbi:cold-shock DNA-binding domain protein [Emticicia oligotrophica DSM 17448]|uniref:Cold-shock DNA-binding domain protein n=1 Tax=Emticicia oligotrophica (strain DSM 17448 / CIP 109782 / MTCC 6937 / GPTSA100-15) TaxID=929562 RepID=A0ABM5MXU6_EMTOG|nr:cold shock domain-containing protein [Emticicia oligotrophica]AFK01958.1 cold-shock DNA-binding domain protein [Emticicia oligotrophica DSM 17448]